MTSFRRLVLYLVLCTAGFLLYPAPALPQSPATQPVAQRDGQHDFDFETIDTAGLDPTLIQFASVRAAVSFHPR